MIVFFGQKKLLRPDKSRGSDYLNLLDMFTSWQKEAAKLEAGEITKEEYGHKYPEYDHKPGLVKAVPSQGLNDLIVNALKNVRKKKNGSTGYR